jgi:8-oxo-dGTP pyrophosphatase MutT (NUDIX family)
MMKELPKWKRIDSKTVYKGRVHVVEHDIELLDGSPSKYEVDHSDGKAVAVLFKTKADGIIVSHQYRFPLDAWIYDLPGGGSPANETLEEGAKREALEEVGLIPNKLVKLATFYPNPGRSDWTASVFFCDDYAEAAATETDPSEIVEMKKLPIAEFAKLVDEGRIVDPMLLIAWHTAISKKLIVPKGK